MPAGESRYYAAAFLLLPLAALAALSRLLAAHSRQPVVPWAVGGYLAWVHCICLYGLLTSTRFEDALGLLTLFTFPASGIVSDVIRNEGFATLPDLAMNYVRYVVCFGGIDAAILAVFLSLTLPGRSLPAEQTRPR